MNAALVSDAAFRDALGKASHVALSAYVLRPGPVERALEQAAGRGADVRVTLEGRPFGGARGRAGPRAANRDVARELRRHGVAVRLTTPAEPALHLKAALVDGTAFLDDRNWAGGNDAVVALTGADAVAAVCAALAGAPADPGEPGPPDLALDKAAALRLETAAIAGGGDQIDVESESFGDSPVYRALRERAEGGAHVRLIVTGRELAGRGAARERAALHRLRDAGVDVRVSARDEKLCVAGDRGWVGSANATYAGAPMRDWGLRTDDPALLAGLEARFQSAWAGATPLRA